MKAEMRIMLLLYKPRSTKDCNGHHKQKRALQQILLCRPQEELTQTPWFRDFWPPELWGNTFLWLIFFFSPMDWGDLHFCGLNPLVCGSLLQQTFANWHAKYTFTQGNGYDPWARPGDSSPSTLTVRCGSFPLGTWPPLRSVGSRSENWLRSRNQAKGVNTSGRLPSEFWSYLLDFSWL